MWEEFAYTGGIKTLCNLQGGGLTNSLTAPRLSKTLEWEFRARRYPHFDHVISDPSEALSYVSDASKVAVHKFLPFLQQSKSTRSFRKYCEHLRAVENGAEFDPEAVIKNRPIKYAAHKDAQVFSYYRYLLAQHYERYLYKKGLDANVIAYRKIESKSGGGKCNIHFAKDAIDEIVSREECTAITMDISKFFESLDHQFLKLKWCEILGVTRLEDDHHHVFKNITNYSFVEEEVCYKALGLRKENGKYVHCAYYMKRRKAKLCESDEYGRKIIAGGLVQKNTWQGFLTPQGIPQGSPISDILANIYMMDFDRAVKAVCDESGAYYRRYSDDILIISNQNLILKIIQEVHKILSKQGASTLKINDEKTTTTQFRNKGGKLTYTGNKFSYLGFTFDGSTVRFRDSTISNFQRKYTLAIKRHVYDAAIKAQSSGKSIRSHINRALLFSAISYADSRDLDKNGGVILKQKRKRNFMTYATKAEKVFSEVPNALYQFSSSQIARHRNLIEKKLEEEILSREKSLK